MAGVIRQSNIVGITIALIIISLFSNMAAFAFDGKTDLNLENDLGESSVNDFVNTNILSNERNSGTIYDAYGEMSDWDETDIKQEKTDVGLQSFFEQVANIGKFLDITAGIIGIVLTGMGYLAAQLLASGSALSRIIAVALLLPLQAILLFTIIRLLFTSSRVGN